MRRVDEEGFDVPGDQVFPAFIDQAVLIPIVDSAQDRTITVLFAQLGNGGVEDGGVDLA